MGRIDIEEEILKLLEIEPMYYSQIEDKLKEANVDVSRGAIFEHLKKLMNESKIRGANEDEKEILVKNHTHKNKGKLYILNDKRFLDMKKIFINILKNKKIESKKDMKEILLQMNNFYKTFYKIKEFDLFLDFYKQMKKFEVDFYDLSMYFNYFKKIADEIIVLYKTKNRKNKNENKVEKLYNKLKEVNKNLFEDYLNLFKKGANQPEIVYPVMDVMHRLNILPSIEDFYDFLIKEKISKDIVKNILIHYLDYDSESNSEKAKKNFDFIISKHSEAYREYLVYSKDPEFRMLVMILDEIRKKYGI